MGKLSAESILFWLDEIKSCEERQKEELIKRNCYPALIDYYEGEMSDPVKSRLGRPEKQLTIINEYFPNTNALISELMYQNPDIVATAQKPQAEDGTQLMQSALTYAFKRLDALTENKLALFDMIYAGYAGVEVNHINQQYKERADTLSDERVETNFLEKATDFVKKVLSKDETEEQLANEAPPEEDNYATQDETYLRRLNPLNVLLDWRAERVKDCRYIIKKIKWSKAEFDSRYPDFKDKVRETGELEYSFHHNERDKKSVTLYEIQIKKMGNKYLSIIVSPSYSLGEIDYYFRPYTTNGFNIKIGTLHEYGKLYSVSFAKVNKAIQDDLNNYITFVNEVAKRNIPKIGVDKNKVYADGIEALQSNKVNDVVPVNGQPDGAIRAITVTNVSLENKEMIQIYQQMKEKLWNVSESRLNGRSKSEFATEMQIQEAGFESRQIDLQLGLKRLIVQELETIKDIIVTYWDGEYFFKITGGQKPQWYEPQVDPVDGTTVLNPLTDILVADYDIDVDIVSALRPNKEKKKKELIDFATWITSPNVVMLLQSKGMTLSIEVLNKVAQEWGWNPETLFEQAPMQQQQVDANGMPIEGIAPGNVPPGAMPSV